MICTNWCVCPLAWLKITKLCPCSTSFRFDGHFESLAPFRKWGEGWGGGGGRGTELTPKQSNRMFLVNVSKV